jgi:hypothetical protein
MRSPALLFATLALSLTSCGKSNLVAVRRPVKPIWVCVLRLGAKQGCDHRFNAALLVGMKLPGAQRLAGHNGYVLRRVAPLRGDEALTADERFNRLDVETDAPNEDSTIIRYADQG